MRLDKGEFYEFHRTRVVSRPGAELKTLEGIEIGPKIPRLRQAIRQVRLGMDVYTPWKFDAYTLAVHAYARAPKLEPAHQSVYYPHYHPRAEHAEGYENREGRPRADKGAPGHVFFGHRGEGCE